jgi:hypothetical protein
VLVLASDGVSDNLWDEQVLREVVRCRRAFLGEGKDAAAKPEVRTGANSTDSTGSEADRTPSPAPAARVGATARLTSRRAMAGMLSEALCSLARRVSERGHGRENSCASTGVTAAAPSTDEDEVPFAKRAREYGRVFRGGKADGEFFVSQMSYGHNYDADDVGL